MTKSIHALLALNGAPARPRLVARAWRWFLAAAGSHRPKWVSASGYLAGALGVACVAFLVGFSTGQVLYDPRSAALAHASGACIALDMAAAHGAIGEAERRMTMRALVSVLNPHFERFPEQVAEFRLACENLTKSVNGGQIARR